MELCPFRDCFISQGRLEFFHLGGQGKQPGTQHLPCLLPLSLQQDLPKPFPGGPTAGPASLTGPAHTWICTIPPAASGAGGKLPGPHVVPHGKEYEEQHCDMSDKTRLLPAVPTPGNNSPAAVRKAFSWGGMGAPSGAIPSHQEPFLLNSCFPEPQESPRSLEGTSQAHPYLGHSTSHGATQML